MEATKILHSSSKSSNSDNNGSWSSETTWTIASGSLKNAVTFDTSYDSPDESESNSSRKFPPLLLNPPLPDSGPCEIKLYFSQKYNIRQIYVRSTARVYEVYCAQSQSSGTEYLCTVRCSIAERNEKVLQAVNVEELSEERAKHGAVRLPKEKFSGEENNSPSEDDWVEVKVFDSPILENGVGSVSNNTNSNEGRHIQDYHEATVEISDSDPCTSLTIRLLSLQNKGVVYIDEVYVFAELVDSIDSENQAPTVNGSAGSSLMAMFVPTLLQLSKSCGSPIQLGKGNKVESFSKSTDVNDIPADFQQGEKLTGDQQYMKLQDVDGSRVESIKSELPNQNANGDRFQDPVIENDSENANGDRSHDHVTKNYSPYGHIERILEQLVSRVSKIEEVCLRFEENMLKPMKCMETRIQQVEQQLESLAKTSQYFGLPSGTRIFAPSFSCESNFSSFHNDGSDCQPCRGPELERKELTSDSLANTSDGMSNSVNAPRLLPSLVVTAPEFSCGDDEQDDDILESFNEPNQDDVVSTPSKDSPQERKKIDDILAAALSRFLSLSSDHPSECEQTSMVDSETKKTINKVPLENYQTLPSKAHEVKTYITTSEEPPKYTQILTVTAPEFTSEENGAYKDSDFTQFPPTESSNFANKKSDDKNGVPMCGAENKVSPVTSDSSDCNWNKSACDPLSISKTIVPTKHVNPNTIVPDDAHTGAAHVLDQSFEDSTTCSLSGLTADQTKRSVNADDHETIKETGQGQPSMVLSPKMNNVHSFGTDLQDHFSEENTNCSFLERSVISTADQAKNSVRIDVCQPTDNSRQRESSIAENKDVLEQCSVYNTAGPVKDILQNVSKSATASLVDFRLPILDVKFASHENSSNQTPLEALLGNLLEFNVEANSVGKDGGALEAAKEASFLDTDDGETIDPLTSKRILVDLGIYEMVVSSDEEGGLDDPCTTCDHEMVASLI